MLAADLLHSVAFKIFDQPVPQSLLLSRLSSLTLCAFQKVPELARDCCGFIFQLFYYLFEPTVVSLFETICSPDAVDSMVAEWLLSLSFPNILFQEIESLTPPHDASRSSPAANRICGLFHVFTYCARSNQMRAAVCNPRFVEVLCKYSGEYPDFVEDRRWEALALIYCRSTSELMGGMFHSAVQILQTDCRKLSLAGISVIELFTQIVKIDDVLRPFMSTAEIIKLVLGLVFENPNHSILQASAREFLSALLLHAKTRMTAIREIVPQVLRILAGADNRNLASSLFEILQTATNIGKTDPRASAIMREFDGFPQFVGGMLAQRNIALNRSYGGPLPGPTLGDVKALAKAHI
jgi:hypothetical protein